MFADLVVVIADDFPDHFRLLGLDERNHRLSLTLASLTLLLLLPVCQDLGVLLFFNLFLALSQLLLVLALPVLLFEFHEFLVPLGLISLHLLNSLVLPLVRLYLLLVLQHHLLLQESFLGGQLAALDFVADFPDRLVDVHGCPVDGFYSAADVLCLLLLKFLVKIVFLFLLPFEFTSEHLHLSADAFSLVLGSQ